MHDHFFHFFFTKKRMKFLFSLLILFCLLSGVRPIEGPIDDCRRTIESLTISLRKAADEAKPNIQEQINSANERLKELQTANEQNKKEAQDKMRRLKKQGQIRNTGSNRNN